MNPWDRIKASMRAFQAALDPTAYAALEAQVAGLELGEAEEKVETTAKLVRMMAGKQEPSEDLKRVFRQEFQQEPPSKETILEAMRNGVSTAEFEQFRREQELVAAALRAQQGRVTGGVGFGGGGSGGGGGGMSSSGTTVGFSGGGAAPRPRISQAEFVRIASQGDLANHVWLQGDGGAGDLLVLSAYQVKPEENTGNLVLVHAEAATPGATLKDTRQRLPPAGGLWWVQGVSLGPELASGARPVVIRASPRDAIAFGQSQERAPKAVDRLRFIPEEDVLEMAGKFLVRGSLNGVPWVLNDSVPNELPLLYVANEALGGVPGTPAEKTLPWAELYARLLLGEEE